MSDRTLVADFVAGYDKPKTRKGYVEVLVLWQRWCEREHLGLLDVGRRDIERWARELEEHGSNPYGRPNSRATVAGRLHVLAAFYHWCLVEELIVATPMLHVRRPRGVTGGSGNYLKRQEMADLEAAAKKKSSTMHVLVCLCGFNGLRVSEALGIDVEHFAMEGWHHLVKVSRKGGKTQWIALHPAVWQAIEMHIGDRTAGPLLQGPKGGPLGYRTALYRLTRLAERAGISKRVTPHSLRRSYVTLSRDARVPDRDIAVSCGWADERPMQTYDRNAEAHDRNPTHMVVQWVHGAA